MPNFLDVIKTKSTSEAVKNLPNQLTASEIELLLLLVKNSNFKGEQLELVYNTVLKLQNQYITLTPKK